MNWDRALRLFLPFAFGFLASAFAADVMASLGYSVWQ